MWHRTHLVMAMEVHGIKEKVIKQARKMVMFVLRNLVVSWFLGRYDELKTLIKTRYWSLIKTKIKKLVIDPFFGTSLNKEKTRDYTYVVWRAADHEETSGFLQVWVPGDNRQQVSHLTEWKTKEDIEIWLAKKHKYDS